MELATHHISEDDYNGHGTCACRFCGSYVCLKLGKYAPIKHSTDCTGIKLLKQLNEETDND